MGTLASNAEFKTLLKQAGNDDPLFARVQAEHFDDTYLAPAGDWADEFAFKEPLSFMVIADSYLHSGQMRQDLVQRVGMPLPNKGGDEKAWIKKYLEVRTAWLAGHGGLLAKTVYRTKAYLDQIAKGNWDLRQLPIMMHGTPVRSSQLFA
jgi:hypothetical protein